MTVLYEIKHLLEYFSVIYCKEIHGEMPFFATKIIGEHKKMF